MSTKLQTLRRIQSQITQWGGRLLIVEPTTFGKLFAGTQQADSYLDAQRDFRYPIRHTPQGKADIEGCWPGEQRLKRLHRTEDKISVTWEEAPFCSQNLSIRWERCLLACTLEVLDILPALAHEMGHVFASELPPSRCEEFDWLGWEYLLAKSWGLEGAWRHFQRDYVVSWGGYYPDFGELTRKEQDLLLERRIRAGQRRKLITEDRRVLPIRRGPFPRR